MGSGFGFLCPGPIPLGNLAEKEERGLSVALGTGLEKVWPGRQNLPCGPALSLLLPEGVTASLAWSTPLSLTRESC